jgi:hypothetical protein
MTSREGFTLMGSSAKVLTFTAVAILAAVAYLIGFAGQDAAADHDPGSSVIDIMAVDVDSTGNTPSDIGTIDDCASLSSVGETIVVDVVVDQIPADGLSGITGDFTYNPAVLQVNSLSVEQIMASGALSPFLQADATPDTDGVFHLDVLDFSGVYESGEGVLVQFVFEAVGSGTSQIGLENFNFG